MTSTVNLSIDLNSIELPFVNVYCVKSALKFNIYLQNTQYNDQYLWFQFTELLRSIGSSYKHTNVNFRKDKGQFFKEYVILMQMCAGLCIYRETWQLDRVDRQTFYITKDNLQMDLHTYEYVFMYLCTHQLYNFINQ